MASWSLVQYRTPAEPAAQVGVLSDGVVRAAPADWPANVLAILDEWRSLEGALRALDVSTLSTVRDAELLAPITFPRKVICAGANYSDHIAEMGDAGLTPPAPFFFLKPPTTTIVAPDADIPLPVADGSRLDWEVELGVVIADRVRGVSAEDALSHVAGYVVANDLSARGFFHRKDAISAPFNWDWVNHKGFDSSSPIGPGLVPEWLVPDAENLALSLTLNGTVKQSANTSMLVAGIAELIAAASAYVTLEPGDVILTGTPSGVGMPNNEYLVEGDVVVAEVEGLGRLTNRIVAAL